MSPPIFSSFPTFDSDSPILDPRRDPGQSGTAASLISRHSDQREPSAAHHHRYSAKRRRKEDHGSRQISRDIGDGYHDDGFRLNKHAQRQSSPGASSSQARDGLSKWSTDQALVDGLMSEGHAGRTRSHYLDAIGDKEAHLYGMTSSHQACPRYRRDQSTCWCRPHS